MPAELQRRHLSPAVAAVIEGAGRSVAEVAATYADAGNDLDRHLAMETDYRYTRPAVRLAEGHVARGGRAWLYRFSWPTPVLDGALRACHTLEVPFVFATQAEVPVLVGDAPPQGLADAVHGAWVRFARTGDPGWPCYDTARRPVMDFGAECRVVDDPQRGHRLLWDDLVNMWASPREG